MKKILSFVLCFAIVVSAFCFSATADDMTTGNSYSELRLSSAEGEYLYYDLVFNDVAQLGVSLMGFELDYPDSMSLVSCKRAYPEGMFITSKTVDEKPYTILWVWGTAELPFEEVVIGKLVFKVSPEVDMDEVLDFDLSYQEGNGPAGVSGKEHTDGVEIVPTPPCDFEDIIEEFPEFRPKSAVILERAVERGRVIGLELYVDPHAEVDLRSISVDIVYPDGIRFGTVNNIYDNGGFDRTGNTLSWNLAEEEFPSEKIKLAELAFTITDDVDMTAPFEITATVKSAVSSDGAEIAEDFIVTSYTFDPSVVVKGASVLTEPDKVKKNPASGEYDIIGGEFEFVFWNGESSDVIPMSECKVAECIRVELDGTDVYHQLTLEHSGVDFTFNTYAPVYSPGDVNGDDNINLTDVSMCLKKIAGWDVTVNPYAADVTGDDVLNLSDTSLILKYIAGWEVTLG